MSDNNSLINENEARYQDLGQNPETIMKGMKNKKLLTYWDYIQIDTLLGLQKPRTHLPDEEIFILYHQVSELYFKMILHEIKQIAHSKHLTAQFFYDRLKRINRYWDVLTLSYAVMRDGMDVNQYLQFRASLIPASGLQSVQYRFIEIGCTELSNLCDAKALQKLPSKSPLTEYFKYIYWQKAGLDSKTGQKSLTLSIFEEKYLDELVQYAEEYRDKNLWLKYNHIPEVQKTKRLRKAMRELDFKVNIAWPLVHYKVAEKYLESDDHTLEATGGSDWKKYLHPKYQRRIFFPELWTSEERKNWGMSKDELVEHSN
ncbi:MAG: tryptophan 2,3-dioxygenase family protein [Bacteroidetes bacterium]|nr:tryptophan 2,3-dioxygenase family protein [Bacteroidota bacterium]